MTNENEKVVNLGDTREIDLPVLDIKPYVGKMAKIVRVIECEGQYGYYIKVETNVLDTIKGSGGVIDLRASRVFGLQSDGEGIVGWGVDTKLGKFLKKMGVDHYRNLKDVEVQVTALYNESKERDYLSFN